MPPPIIANLPRMVTFHWRMMAGKTDGFWRHSIEMTAYSLNAQKILAFKKIHADFQTIMKHEKCRTCACFYGDVLTGVYEKIRRFRETDPERSVAWIEKDFERWLREADALKTHG
jgi:hypothetical protein